MAGIDIIPLSSPDALRVLGGANDPSADLYANGADSQASTALTEWLAPQLPEDIDVILLFENPVPFLETLYPDALIIHQMPGAFARPPYPHTIQFDPGGLFRASALYATLSALPAAPRDDIPDGIDQFSEICRATLASQPFAPARAEAAYFGTGRRFLLPLQISDHYAFQVDTPFDNQVSLVHAALDQLQENDSLLLTEYATGPYAEPVCTPDLLKLLREIHPHVVFDPAASKINSVSQHILPDVAGVITASSSLAAQSLVWDHEIRVLGDTHLAPFDTRKLADRQARRTALHEILGKNQPLSAAVVEDGAFLSSLLEELHSRRKLPLTERCVAFDQIDPDYWDRLQSAFRPRQIDRALRASKARPKRAVAFQRLLSKEDPALVSFDLFDTLVLRPVENPADVYALLEQRLARQGDAPPLNFAEARLAAELEARQTVPVEEIQLTDIYAQKALAHLPEAQREKFAATEIELEIDLARPRPTGIELLTEAQKTDAALCITSDMYLPESCVTRLIEKAGIDPEIPLFLSSTIGVTKKSGGLFTHIMDETGHGPRYILHVGDTEKTDITPAEKLGLKTFHLPKSIAYLRSNPIWKHAYPRDIPIETPERSLVVAALSHRLFDDPDLRPRDSAFNGDAESFGYAAIGPLLLGFANWLLAEARLRNLKTLHFLSREGLIFREAFDLVNNASETGIDSNYLFGSRRAIRMANLTSRLDIADMARGTIDATARVGDLLAGRFGLTQDEVSDEMLKAAGFTGWSARTGTTQAQKDRFCELALSLEETILAKAREERDIYRAYLDSRGILDTPEIAIVDVGWQGNMQGALGTLVGRPLTGFYLATLNAARRWSAQGHVLRGYLANFVDRIGPEDAILSNRLLVEHILCAITPSIIGVRRQEGDFAPVYQDHEDLLAREMQIGPIHRGALNFVRDITQLPGGIGATLDLTPEFASRVLEGFLAHPSAEDARLFANHEIDDAFSGAATRYYLKCTDRSGEIEKSYWKPGAKALAPGPTRPPQDGKSRRPKTPAKISYRARLTLTTAWPVLKSHLSEREIRLYKTDPTELFANARHPAMIFVGRTAGLI
ncbi:MAG: hypothetical protein OIF48_20630 [Silicimonas sp.]|nr:hypothetical protein [Silicimonas sp.]